MTRRISISKILIYLIILFYASVCILPFLLVAAGSLTSEQEIIHEGFKLIPKKLDTTAYKLLFLDPGRIFNAYKITFSVTIAGTLSSLLISSMLAYPMSRKDLKYRGFISGYVLITILFNGGMVPWYIVCVRYLHLKDTVFALIVPYLVVAWNVFLLRNYFQTIPMEMHESAKIDGAGEFIIFFRIILPLSTPVLATIALFIALMYWNDWWLGIMLIDKNELQPLQLLLRTIVSNIMFLRSSSSISQMSEISSSIPAESTKMATCIITIGPIIFLYPFIQRYFVKGIMIGAVKG